MAGGLRKPVEGVLLWEFVLVLWVGATEEFSKAKGIFLKRINNDVRWFFIAETMKAFDDFYIDTYFHI